MRHLLIVPTLVALVALGGERIGFADQNAAAAPHAFVPRGPTPARKFVDDEAVVAFVDGQIRAGWKDSGLESSPTATAGEWCRRVYLDVLGRIPTVDELARFQRDPPAKRKAGLVERLLNSSQYETEYANYWATLWSNVLVGRPTIADAPTQLTNREGLAIYLRNCFARNKPYDLLVYELITATGNTTPGQADFNGATNFLVDKLDHDGVEATEQSAACFLAVRLQCSQCHNDPFCGRTQHQYWRMNAFFRQANVQALSAPDQFPRAVLRDVDFLSESGDLQRAEIYFESPWGKKMNVAYPEFVDGTRIEPSGELSAVNRRAELGRLMIQSDYLAPAIVNRLWAHFLSFGFSDSLENLGPEVSTSHPELLAALAHEFAARRYDLKSLIRWIVLSEPYGLSSSIGKKNRADDPSLGERPRYTRFYPRAMQQEQVLASLLGASDPPGQSNGIRVSTDSWRRQLLAAFGSEDGAGRAPSIATVQKSLMMLNGPLTAEATAIGPGSFLHDVLSRGRTSQETLDRLFLTALSRKPSAADAYAARQLMAVGGDCMATYQDIWWALLNSNEFILNH